MNPGLVHLALLMLACGVVITLAGWLVDRAAARKVARMTAHWERVRQQERDDATLAAGDEFRAWLAHPSQADPFAITRRQIAALKTIEDIA